MVDPRLMLSRLLAGAAAGGPAGDAPGAATALPAVKKATNSVFWVVWFY